MERPRPAMRGRYSIRNPAANLLLRGLDAGLRLVVGQQTAAVIPGPVRRILISNIAHLGDVIVATSVLPALQARFPDAEFGFLVGSWSLPVLRGHPLVARRHVLDHWMHSRAPLSRREKWRIYRRTRAQALSEVKAAQYDIALDLYWNLPNTLLFLRQAGIPVRAGYGSAGLGPLATHCLDLAESREHISERHARLLGLLAVDAPALSRMKPTLPGVSPETAQEVALILQEAGVQPEKLIVFHPGAGDAIKEWPEDRWRHLVTALTACGYSVVLTGHGADQEAAAQRIAAGLSGCVSLCGCLPWPSFVAVIAQADLIVCVDTVAGHVAGAVGTPTVVLTTGRNPYLWKPMGALCRQLLVPVPCSPCHLNNGCVGMECIRTLEAAQVQQVCLAALGLLADPKLAAVFQP